MPLLASRNCWLKRKIPFSCKNSLKFLKCNWKCTFLLSEFSWNCWVKKKIHFFNLVKYMSKRQKTLLSIQTEFSNITKRESEVDHFKNPHLFSQIFLQITECIWEKIQFLRLKCFLRSLSKRKNTLIHIVDFPNFSNALLLFHNFPLISE